MKYTIIIIAMLLSMSMFSILAWGQTNHIYVGNGYRISETVNRFEFPQKANQMHSIQQWCFNDKYPDKVWMVERKEKDRWVIGKWMVYSLCETKKDALKKINENKTVATATTNTVEWTGWSPSGKTTQLHTNFVGNVFENGMEWVFEITESHIDENKELGFRSDGVIVWRNKEGK